MTDAEVVADEKNYVSYCIGCQRYFDTRVGCLNDLRGAYDRVAEAAEEFLLSESRVALSKLDYSMQGLRIAKSSLGQPQIIPGEAEHLDPRSHQEIFEEEIARAYDAGFSLGRDTAVDDGWDE